MAEPIRLDELMAELERLGVPNGGDDGMTCRELTEHWKCSVGKVHELVRKFLAAGLVVPGRGMRSSIDGTRRPTPVYRFVQPAKKGKNK